MSTVVTKKTRLSSVWLLPIIAILIGFWMTANYFYDQGPTVTIIISDAEGLEAGKTLLKTRSVTIGQIESIELNKNFSEAVITARLNKAASSLLVKDTKFWIVKPRVGQSGVSGLGTLFSGAYIEVRPGKEKDYEDKFNLLDNPPITGVDAKGIYINLETNYTSLSASTPILYKGFKAGVVENINYDINRKITELSVFINAPFDKLVTQNTKFWQSPAFAVSLTSSGVDVKLDSLDSLLRGSIAFGLPIGEEAGKEVKPHQKFNLYANEESIIESTYNNYVDYVLLFDQSVEGLHNDALVKFRGIRLGSVLRMPYFEAISNEKHGFQGMIPILIRIQLDRWPNLLHKEFQIEQLNNLVKNGLKARLKSSNLLTGSKYIDLFFDNNAADSSQIELAMEHKLNIIPTSSSSFDELEQKITTFLDKINELPIDDTITNLNSTLVTAESTLGELHSILAELKKSKTPQNLDSAIKQLDNTLAAYSDDSVIYNELKTTNKEIQQALNELRPFLQKISEKPNAIIFNETKQSEPKLRN